MKNKNCKGKKITAEKNEKKKENDEKKNRYYEELNNKFNTKQKKIIKPRKKNT